MILNQLVTEILVKGDVKKLEDYDKSLKKINEDLSVHRKRLNEIKNDTLGGVLSEKSKLAKAYINDLQKSYSSAVSISKEEYDMARRPIIEAYLRRKREGVLTRRQRDIFRKASLEQLGGLRTGYSKNIKDIEKEFAGKYDKPISDIQQDKEYKEKKKKEIESLKQSIGALQEQKDVVQEDKKQTKEKMGGTLLGLGKFTAGLAVATVALKAVSEVWGKFRDINAGYLGAEFGGRLTTKQLQSTAMALRGYGVNIGKKELTGMLGKADYSASTREFGQNMNAKNLAMAGLNPANALTTTDLLSGLYTSYLSGTKQALIASALISEGLPAGEIINAFKVARKRGVTAEAFRADLEKERSGLTTEENIENLSKTGAWNKFKDEFTGKAGEIFSSRGGANITSQLLRTNPMLAPASIMYDLIKSYQPQSGQTGNIYYQPQNTYHIETQSLDGLDRFTDDGLQFKISELNSGGN